MSTIGASIVQALGGDLSAIVKSPGGMSALAELIVKELGDRVVRRRRLAANVDYEFPFTVSERDYSKIKSLIGMINVTFRGSTAFSLCRAMRALAMQMFLKSQQHATSVCFTSRVENFYVSEPGSVYLSELSRSIVSVKDRAVGLTLESQKGRVQFIDFSDVVEKRPVSLVFDCFDLVPILSMVYASHCVAEATDGFYPDVYFSVPFSPETLLLSSGRIDELDLEFRRFGEKIGFYSSRESFEYNYFEYKELVTATQVSHPAVPVNAISEARLEIPGMFCGMIRISPRRDTTHKELKIFRSVVARSKVIVNGYSYIAAAVVKKRFLIPEEMYSRAMTYAASLSRENFSLEQIVQGVLVYGDVTAIAARTLKTTAPLSGEAMYALASAVYLKQYEVRYDYTQMLASATGKIIRDVEREFPGFYKKLLRIITIVGIPVLLKEFPLIAVSLMKLGLWAAQSLPASLVAVAAKVGLAVSKIPLGFLKLEVILAILPTIVARFASSALFRCFDVERLPLFETYDEILKDDEFPALTGFGLSASFLPRPAGYTMRVSDLIYVRNRSSMGDTEIRIRHEGVVSSSQLMQIGKRLAVRVKSRAVEIEYRDNEWMRPEVFHLYLHNGEEGLFALVEGTRNVDSFDAVSEFRTPFTSKRCGFMYATGEREDFDETYVVKLTEGYTQRNQVTAYHHMYKIATRGRELTEYFEVPPGVTSLYSCYTNEGETLWRVVRAKNKLKRQILDVYTCRLLSGEPLLPEVGGNSHPNFGIDCTKLFFSFQSKLRQFASDLEVNIDNEVVAKVLEIEGIVCRELGEEKKRVVSTNFDGSVDIHSEVTDRKRYKIDGAYVLSPYQFIQIGDVLEVRGGSKVVAKGKFVYGGVLIEQGYSEIRVSTGFKAEFVDNWLFDFSGKSIDLDPYEGIGGVG